MVFKVAKEVGFDPSSVKAYVICRCSVKWVNNLGLVWKIAQRGIGTGELIDRYT